MCILCNASQEQQKEYGVAFGYPDCCINEYINDSARMMRTKIDPRNRKQIKIAREKYGFVPCKYHAMLIHQGKTTAEELVANRRNAEQSSELNKLAQETGWED
jgi:hypothetical protein